MLAVSRFLCAIAVVGCAASCGGLSSGAADVADHSGNAGHAPVRPAFPPLPPGGVHSLRDAQRLADAVVAGAPVPPGAVAQSTTPPGALVPDFVDLSPLMAQATRWYTTPGTRDAAVAWLDAQHPDGFSLWESHATGETAALSWPRHLSLSQPPLPPRPNLETHFTVLQEGDHADVRVDAYVVWTPAKTPIETIPATVATGSLDWSIAFLPGGPRHRHHVLTRAEVGKIRTLLNAQQTLPPGTAAACPGSLGEVAVLAFQYDDEHVTFRVELDGCRNVTVRADNRLQPEIALGGYALAAPLRAMVGRPVTDPSVR